MLLEQWIGKEVQIVFRENESGQHIEAKLLATDSLGILYTDGGPNIWAPYSALSLIMLAE